MKILLSRSSVNQVVGGAELSARDITRSLIKLGHTPVLVTNIKKPVVTDFVPSSAIKHPPSLEISNRLVRKILKPLSFIVQLLWYWGLSSKLKPDIINPQSRDDQLILTLVGKITRTPVVWRDPGDLAPQLKYPIKGIGQRFSRRMQTAAIRRADHIFTLNGDERKVILDLVPELSPERISVVGSNILFEDYYIKPDKSHNPITIGSVSRLDKHKGIQYLLAAFGSLQEEYDNSLRLTIAGDGNYRQELEYQAKNIPGVEFIGNATDVSEVFNKIDIFVQPSEFEGWGRNVKEAMFFGLPIVGSRVGGIKRQISHNETGLLFTPKDSHELLIELRKLVESKPLREKLGKNAKQKAISDGDWVATVKNEMVPLLSRYSTEPRIRIESGSFIASTSYSGVGYYSRMLSESFASSYSTDLITGPFKKFSLGNKAYNKLASYGLAWPVDLFMKPVDLTILPNFAYWPTVKSRQTAVVIHDLTYLHFPELVEKKNLAYLRRVVPRAIKKADFIITVSEAVKSELVNEFGIDKSKIVVTHIPADKRFKNIEDIEILTKYNLPTKEFIFFVGNMEPRKNLSRLIKAYLLLDDGLRSRYSLVLGGGKGWNSSETEALVKKAQQSGENIIHVGYIDDEDLPSFYKQASLFAMPSLYEGFGMPVLEAMSVNTPVLAADTPVMREVGGEAAVYTNPKDSVDIAKGITLILTDTRFTAKMIDHSKKHLSKFSWNKNIDAILSQAKQNSP